MADFPSTAKLIGMVQAFEVNDANMAAQWFPKENTHSNFYEFDIIEWSRTKGKFRLPDGVAGTQAVRPKTRKKIELPTQREKKMLKESTIRWMDAPGKKMPDSGLQAVSGELEDLDLIIERTHEWVRWQLLTTGAVTLVGDVTDTYTFGIGTTATAAVAWSTVATSDPISDIIIWKEAVAQASGVQPTEIILSTLAIKYIFQSTKALALLGEATKDQFRATGTVPMLVGMKVIVQDGGYRNESNVFKRFLSTDGVEGDMCIIKASGAVGVTAQGPPVDSEAPENMVGKFAKTWKTQDPSGRWILECHTALAGLTLTNNLGAFTLW